MTPTRLLASAALLCLAALPAAAQEASGKRPLTVHDFEQWRSIRHETLSPDGRWVVYTQVPQVGEGEVVVRAVTGGTEHRHTRGYIGRPQTRAGADRGDAFPISPARITPDARWVVFTVEPPRDSVEAARRAKKKPDEQPKTSLGIMSLPGGQVTLVPRVKSFRMPDDSGRWLAYLLEADTAKADSAAAPPDSAAAAAAPVAAATPGGEPRPVSADTTKKDEKKKDPGTTLVLRDLATGEEVRIEEVVSYAFDDAGRWLAYTVSSRATPERDGVYVRSLWNGRTHDLLTGRGEYKQVAFSEDGAQLAWVSNRDEYAAEKPRYALYHATLAGTPRVREVLAEDAAGAGRLVSERGSVRFSENGRALVFGVAPVPPDSIPADSLADKAVFDLWHWQDTRLQPQQRVNAAEERNRTWTSVLHLGSGRHVVLESDSILDAELSDDGLRAMATTWLPYAVEAMWTGGASDVYAVDARTGAMRRVAQRVPFRAEMSADGQFITWFGTDRRWHAYEFATGRTVDLTGGIDGVRFDQETWDTPSDPAPWGIAGWTEDDRSVLVYDRYDVWEIDPRGRRAPRMVTDSAGRGSRMTLRVVDLDREEDAIDPARPLLLRAMSEDTKQSGFWRDDLRASAPPVRLLMEDRLVGPPQKADSADVFLFTRQTVAEFPDLWASGPGFADAAKLSDANPQQQAFLWPSVELVRWRSDDGVELQGLLYRPEGFDPTKQYPMVVYFYEKLSDELHRYRMDVPRNLVHPTLYPSNGYLVFIPDIEYTDGFPGASALKAIVPGVQSLIARGFVDPQGVGIGGQSWGGYQAAYIITRTPLFRAAMAGAPVSNMTSAYGGIRWGSGLARSFQYEVGQSRIGGSLWERPWHYVENSPLFMADRVETPLLIMHNDNDGAVPWYQGIEMFVALRRLGKEVYLINYNGDEHNPTKRANQIDLAQRMLEFYGHHLRGEPAPAWMREGIPFLDKGRDQLGPPPARVPAPEPATAQP